MFLKINLFQIPEFYIKKESHDQEYANSCVAEFDTKRGQYGFKKMTIRQTNLLKKQFLKEYGFILAFNTKLSLELYKQGRTQRWLHRSILERNIEISYNLFTKKINGYIKIEPELKELITAILIVY